MTGGSAAEKLSRQGVSEAARPVWEEIKKDPRQALEGPKPEGFEKKNLKSTIVMAGHAFCEHAGILLDLV